MVVEEWRRKLRQFMTGRYGIDQFGRFLNGTVLALLLVYVIFRRPMLYSVALLIMVYYCFRVFSRNISARFKENERFLHVRFRVRERWEKWKAQAEQMRKFHIYRCPGCGQKIRIPRGRGKVKVRCPKCHTEFIKKS